MSRIYPKAKEWATVCLDPYHDYSVSLEGCPDKQTGRSYVRVHNQAVSVSPTADGDNLSIHFTGLHSADSWTPANSVVYQDALNQKISCVNIMRSASAAEPNYAGLFTGSTDLVAKFSTALDAQVPSRLIAIGLEVHDMTAALYKKGTITATHLQGAIQHIDVLRTIDEPVGTSLLIERQDCVQAVPGTLSKLQSYPAVLTLPASKGAYIVGRMYGPRKPVLTSGTNTNVNAHAWAIPEMALSQVTYMRGATNTDSELNYESGATHSGFDGFYLRLTGLPIEGQYRITLRTVIEYFPDPFDSTSLGIATMSPPYCPDIFQSYHQVVTSLPTCVPVGSNASGDYWRAIISVAKRVAPVFISHIAPIALTALGQPELAAIAAAVGKTLDHQLKAKQPQKQGAQQKPLPKRRLRVSRKR